MQGYPIQQQPMVGGHPMGIVPGQVQPMIGGAGGMQWMARPAPIPGVPPGLEYLSSIDHLLVQQQVDMLEAFTGWEQCNKYRVFNNLGQQCYYAFEESSTCQRLCCGTHREFIIHIVDNMNQVIFIVA